MVDVNTSRTTVVYKAFKYCLEQKTYEHWREQSTPDLADLQDFAFQNTVASSLQENTSLCRLKLYEQYNSL